MNARGIVALRAAKKDGVKEIVERTVFRVSALHSVVPSDVNRHVVEGRVKHLRSAARETQTAVLNDVTEVGVEKQRHPRPVTLHNVTAGTKGKNVVIRVVDVVMFAFGGSVNETPPRCHVDLVSHLSAGGPDRS